MMPEATAPPKDERSPAAARLAALHAAGAVRRPNPAVWSRTGELRPQAAREIARRLKAGDEPDAIIAHLGISRQAGRRNELCLAVLEGRVAEGDIKPAAKTYTSRALAEWQNQHGPRSLDERRGEDGGQALIDLLADDTSANLIDDIEFGDGT